METTQWCLSDLDQLGLIILGPTGVSYYQQCGGFSCDERLAEGSLVLLNKNVLKDGNWHKTLPPLAEYFTSEKWHGWCDDGIDSETADFIDKHFEWSEHQIIKVDRNRLHESCEAWIHVKIYYMPAILTWPNSD